jgi:hypothetical protein
MTVRPIVVSVLVWVAGCNGAQNSATISPQALAHACAIAVSCDAQPGLAVTGGTCAQELLTVQLAGDSSLLVSPSVVERFARCAASGTCEEALACASLQHGPDYCLSHAGATCDGDVLVECTSSSGWAVSSIDCAADGQRCVTLVSGAIVLPQLKRDFLMAG